MKIIAVIPARAGSRGIPNKNIRLINGRPLIAYSIDNAKKSKYINDIIVSSDSKEVKIIAEYMNVQYKERDKALCDEKTTLDSVIYDAVHNLSYDIVITMQPTSPTLRPETLDSAIEYFIANDLDTLISACNDPRLSWRREQSRIVPNYKKRVNRQY